MYLCTMFSQSSFSSADKGNQFSFLNISVSETASFLLFFNDSGELFYRLGTIYVPIAYCCINSIFYLQNKNKLKPGYIKNKEKGMISFKSWSRGKIFGKILESNFKLCKECNFIQSNGFSAFK